MSIQQSILHVFQASDSNIGNIDTTGIITDELSDIKGWNKTGLEFLSEPFSIEPENQIIVYRRNRGNASPCIIGNVWDYDSKAVSTKSGFGIYGYTLDMCGCRDISIGQLESIVRNKISNTIDNSIKDQVILELEVDKRNVLYKGNNEIAFSECNILGIIKPEELIKKKYPQCTELLDLYDKAMDNPSLYGDKFLTEKRTKYDSIMHKEQTIDSQKAQFEIIKSFAINRAKPSDIHGLSHWQRVERNAVLLAEKTGADLQVLCGFAYLHDMCRENDGYDPEHGLRASKLIKEYAGSLFHGVEDNIVYRLCFACENHTRMLRCGDPLIDTCFDADRLDLTRVGIKPDPAKMATELGAYLAANPDIYLAEIEKISL